MTFKPNVAGVLICVACGVLDATCFVALGGTFVGLMTGNLILMGAALSGANTGVSPGVFFYPLGGYAAGALLAGILFRLRQFDRASRDGLWLAWLLLLVITITVWVAPIQPNTVSGWLVVAATASYLGFQSAVLYLSRRVTITTNVMTSTLTSFLADYPVQVFRRGVTWQKFYALIGFVTGVVIGAWLAKTNLAQAFLFAVVLATVAMAGVARDPARTC